MNRRRFVTLSSLAGATGIAAYCFDSVRTFLVLCFVVIFAVILVCSITWFVAAAERRGYDPVTIALALVALAIGGAVFIFFGVSLGDLQRLLTWLVAQRAFQITLFTLIFLGICARQKKR